MLLMSFMLLLSSSLFATTFYIKGSSWLKLSDSYIAMSASGSSHTYTFTSENTGAGQWFRICKDKQSDDNNYMLCYNGSDKDNLPLNNPISCSIGCWTEFKMSGEKGRLKKYVVYEATKKIDKFSVQLTHGNKETDAKKKTKKDIEWCYAFTVKEGEGEGSSSDWKAGDAYGFEFADITLPHGYIFGDNYSTNQDEPIEALDDKTLDIRPDDTTTNGIEIKSLRPRGKQLEKVMVGVARPNTK